MSDFQITGNYQGLDVLAAAVSRKPGVTPDRSWIEVGTEQIKGFSLVDTFRLWGAAQIVEPPGPLSVGAAMALKGGDLTVVTQPPPKQDQLLRCGPLIFNTSIDGVPVNPEGTTRFEFMFIDKSGFEELEEDLRDALAHSVGRLRIHLVDFRHYWKDFGSPCYGRYNFVNEDGSHDPTTLNPKTGKPWNAKDIFEYIARSLPGKPSIHPSSDIFADATGLSVNPDLRDPVALEMKMELPAVWLHRLLQVYDMEVHLTFDYRLYIVKENSEVTPREFLFGGSSLVTPKPLPDAAGPDNPTSEKITVYNNDAPEAVLVAGGMRKRRNTEQCVPVFVDEFNQIQRLIDVGDIWPGYSYEQARAQRLIHHSKSYEDVPGADSRQKTQRIEIARKHFFKTYAPVSLFREPTENDFPKGEPAPVVAWPTDRERHPLLPMEHPWYTPNEVETYFSNQTAVPVPLDPEVSVDLIETPFVVRAFQIKQQYSDRVDYVEASVRSHLESIATYISVNAKQIEALLAELKDLGVTPGKSKRGTDGIWAKMGFLARAEAILDRGVDQFLSNATTFLTDLGLPTPTGSSLGSAVDRALQAEADTNAFKNQRITQLEAQIEHIQNQSLTQIRVAAEIKANLSAISTAMKNWKYAKLWINTPYGLVDHGSFQVIPDRGLIHFHDIAGSMNYGAVYDTEDAQLVSDGAVQITWNSDKITGSPEEMSYWVFLRNDADLTKPKLCRIVEPSPAKPMLVRDEDLVLAENENGASLNADQVTEKAARLAAGPLSAPRQQTGYTWTYPGFWAIQTDGGYNSVAWVMKDTQDGHVTAHTIIRAGNPDDSSLGMQSVSRKKYQEKLLYGDKDLRRWHRG